MKKLLFITACLFSYLFTSAQVEVGADKSFKESLNDYHTYGWSTEMDKVPTDAIFVGPNGVLVFNNESTRAKIKEAIAYELSVKGFKYDQANPDILVLFSVTEQPAKLVTFNGYQIIDNGMDSIRTKDDMTRTDIKAGTLIINLLDAKTGVVAWQGYASGILKPDMANNDSEIRRAVSDIFKKFTFRAKE